MGSSSSKQKLTIYDVNKTLAEKKAEQEQSRIRGDGAHPVCCYDPFDRSGLSSCHISPHGYGGAWTPKKLFRIIKFSPGGANFEAKPAEGVFGQFGPGALRGEISEYSDKSRLRMMRGVAGTDQEAMGPPWFLTLTYKEWVENYEAWKRDLDVWVKRLKRQYPMAVVLWRLEFQKRGAPHFHLMVWNCLAMDCTKDQRRAWFRWVARSWWETVGSGDLAHLKAGTRVEKIRSLNGTFYYLAKYLGKDDQARSGLDKVGRFWGWYGRAFIIRCEKEVAVHWALFEKIRARVREWCASTSRGGWVPGGRDDDVSKGFRCFVPSEVLGKILSDLGVWMGEKIPWGMGERVLNGWIFAKDEAGLKSGAFELSSATR